MTKRKASGTNHSNVASPDDKVATGLRVVILETYSGTPGDDEHVGTDAADVLNGFAGDDVLHGAGGDDRINGGDDDDMLYGDDADDTLDAGGGRNQVYGGSGADHITSHGGVDTIDGGDDHDDWIADYSTLLSTLSYDQSAGSLSDGTSIVNVETIQLTSGYGDDRFELDGSVRSYLHAAAGNDILVVDLSERTGGAKFKIAGDGVEKTGLSGKVYMDNYLSFDGINSIEATASSKNDSFYIGAVSAAKLSALRLDGAGGRDTLVVRFSNAPSTQFFVDANGGISASYGHFADFEFFGITLGKGANHISIAGDHSANVSATKGGTNVIELGDTSDRATSRDATDTITTGKGDDTITSTDSVDTIDGGEGSDYWYGNYSDTGLQFHQEDGTLSDGSSITSIENVFLNLGGSACLISLVESTQFSGRFSSVQRGTLVVRLNDDAAGLAFAGMNKIISGDSQSIFQFGAATVYNSDRLDLVSTGFNDTFTFDRGFITHQQAITIDAGAGVDSLTIDLSGRNSVTFTVDPSGDVHSESGLFSGFEVYDITIGGGNNVITVGAGDDLITASLDATGHNILDGAGGNDTVRGGAGEDLLRGGDGSDLLAGNNGDDVLNGGASDDIIDGGLGDDTASFRNAASGVHVAIVAGQQDTGGAGVDLLASIENLTGSSFDDRLTGDSGRNTLLGSNGNDKLLGNDAADVLEGDAGADQMTGGAGADRFVFASVDDFGQSSRDKILDFTHSDKDLIDLSLIDTDTSTPGDQGFAFIGSDEFSGTGSVAELRFMTGAGGKILVEGDTDHDGSADFSFTVMSSTDLVAKDFIL